MHKFSFSVLSFLFVFCSIAQSIDRDNIRYVGMQYPTVPLPTNSTYRVVFDVDQDLLNSLDHLMQNSSDSEKVQIGAIKPDIPGVNPLMSRYFNLKASRYDPNGSYQIRFYLNKFTIDEKEQRVIEYDCGTKDKPKKCKSYVYDITYSYESTVTLVSPTGQNLFLEQLNSKTRNVKTRYGKNLWGRFDTLAKLIESYSDNRRRFIRVLKSAAALEALTRAGQVVERKSEFVQVSKSVMLPSMKRKHNYSDLDDARNLVKTALQRLEGRPLTSLDNTLLEKAISIWERALPELDPRDKKARIGEKGGSVVYYNLARANFYLGNRDKAKMQIEQGLKLGKISASLKGLRGEIEAYEKLSRTVIPQYTESKVVRPSSSYASAKKSDMDEYIRFSREGLNSFSPLLNQIKGIVKATKPANQTTQTPAKSYVNLTNYQGSYVGQYNSASLTATLFIRNAQSRSFDFELNVVANNGNCTGELRGIANLVDANVAKYTGQGCDLTFNFNGPIVQVVEGNCSAHGMNCGFGMNYRLGTVSTPDAPAEEPVEEAVPEEEPAGEPAEEPEAEPVQPVEVKGTYTGYFDNTRIGTLDAEYLQASRTLNTNFSIQPSKEFYFIFRHPNGREIIIEEDNIFNFGYQADPGRRGFQLANTGLGNRGSRTANITILMPFPFGDGGNYDGHAFQCTVIVSGDDGEPYSNQYLPNPPQSLEDMKSGYLFIESSKLVESTDVFGKPAKARKIVGTFVVEVASQSGKYGGWITGKMVGKFKVN